MAKYGVFDNGKPASQEGFPGLAGCGWVSHIFPTFPEACFYASEWLFDYSPTSFVLGEKHDYSGYGDYIEIRLMEE